MKLFKKYNKWLRTNWDGTPDSLDWPNDGKLTVSILLSIPLGVGFIILNIFTLGIPAILLVCYVGYKVVKQVLKTKID